MNKPLTTNKSSATFIAYLIKLPRLILGGSALVFAYIILSHLPVTYSDWFEFFQPAALSLADPYRIEGVLNPPWTFVLLYPLAKLPGNWGAGGLALLSAGAIVLYTRSLGKTLAVALSAPFVFAIVLGQLDALILYGLFLPAVVGIPLILIKPQAAALTVLNRLNRRALLWFALFVLLSLLIWMNWPVNMFRNGLVPDTIRNASLFPFSLLLAPVLIYYGIKHKSDALLSWATLCLVPFFQTHSMLVAVATTIKEIRDWRIWVLVTMLSWGYYSIVVGWVN